MSSKENNEDGQEDGAVSYSALKEGDVEASLLGDNEEKGTGDSENVNHVIAMDTSGDSPVKCKLFSVHSVFVTSVCLLQSFTVYQCLLQFAAIHCIYPHSY